jgi:YHS domain-containing protein
MKRHGSTKVLARSKMKRWLFPTVAVTLWTAGCAPNTEQAAAPTQPAQIKPVKLTAAQELTKYCRVCVVDKGEKIEEFFPSRLDTKQGGKTYKFCSDDCKKKFDANSKRYALK